jgi:hypothetical protein
MRNRRRVLGRVLVPCAEEPRAGRIDLRIVTAISWCRFGRRSITTVAAASRAPHSAAAVHLRAGRPGRLRDRSAGADKRSTVATNRYPRRGIVSTYRGCRTWSLIAIRICRTL